MTEPHSNSPRYDSTRKAWETIWDSASMDVELQAVRYPSLNGDDLRVHPVSLERRHYSGGKAAA
ncbi:MAG: hypothetical protein H6671_12365 [Anaerolineaceae bacterium]|nr:hypothetical protein [Anaerolineaceae bacterium]